MTQICYRTNHCARQVAHKTKMQIKHHRSSFKPSILARRHEPSDPRRIQPSFILKDAFIALEYIHLTFISRVYKIFHPSLFVSSLPLVRPARYPQPPARALERRQRDPLQHNIPRHLSSSSSSSSSWLTSDEAARAWGRWNKLSRVE